MGVDPSPGADVAGVSPAQERAKSLPGGNRERDRCSCEKGCGGGGGGGRQCVQRRMFAAHRRRPPAAAVCPVPRASQRAWSRRHDRSGTAVAYVPQPWRGRERRAESLRHAPRGPHSVAGRQLGGNNLRIVAGGARTTREMQPCSDATRWRKGATARACAIASEHNAAVQRCRAALCANTKGSVKGNSYAMYDASCNMQSATCSVL
jgi:hypothetical protein